MFPYGLEDLEEAARRARAREVYAKMYPLNTDDPYGEKRSERVQTPAGVKRVFNQVAREMGLGSNGAKIRLFWEVFCAAVC